MRLPPDGRRRFELGLRGAALVLLAWMIARSAAPRDSATVQERTDSHALNAALAAWTLAPEPTAVHVNAAFAPAARDREWLRALAHAGMRVSWSGDSIPATAVEVAARSDPAGGVRAYVSAPAGTRATLSDAVGLIDTLSIAPGSNALALPMSAGAIDLLARRQHARAIAPDSLVPRQVVLLGRAGWEGKFAMAALEERGWKVSSRLRVGPGVFVSQGTPLALDTAHTAVIVALDSSAAQYASAIASFERNGGGVVLAGDAPLAVALRPLAPGRAGARVAAASLSFASTAPRRALGFFPILALANDAVPLESRDGHVIAAARRLGAGRVVQLGYDETWRWRLAGTGDAPAAHRDYWQSVIAAAAYRAMAPVADAAQNADAAPLAALYADLGAPSAPSAAALHVTAGLRWWMFAALALLLLAEWASRRLRGAR
ncbi:MAG: hypothetical protein M3Y30_00865 [Gemmatimonadota bacterium]|nr:hypothetical protein [Gemmatimonadota bacterium]